MERMKGIGSAIFRWQFSVGPRRKASSTATYKSAETICPTRVRHSTNFPNAFPVVAE